MAQGRQPNDPAYGIHLACGHPWDDHNLKGDKPVCVKPKVQRRGNR